MSDIEMVQAFVSALGKVFTLGSYHVKLAMIDLTGTRCLHARISWRGEEYNMKIAIASDMNAMLAGMDWAVKRLRHDVVLAAGG